MVKLQVIPDVRVVRAFKGSVDFYTWKGISVARGWPRKPVVPPGTNIALQQPWLMEAMARYRAVGLVPSLELKWLVRHGTQTARDIFMTHYFGTTFTPSSSHWIGQSHASRAVSGLSPLDFPFIGLAGGSPGEPNGLTHKPSPPFPFPDPDSHYFTAYNYSLYWTDPTHLWLQALHTSDLPSRWPLFYDRPTFRPQYYFRRGIRFYGGPAWELKGPAIHFLSVSTAAYYVFRANVYLAYFNEPGKLFYTTTYASKGFGAYDHESIGFCPVLGVRMPEALPPSYPWSETQPSVLDDDPKYLAVPRMESPNNTI